MSVSHITGLPLNSLPTGAIVMWCGSSSVPNGWLMCDGTPKKQREFKKLHAVIGSYYNTGGEITTGPDAEFRLPSIGNRYIRGGAPSTVTYGGNNNHDHPFTSAWSASTNSDGGHSHTGSLTSTSGHNHGHAYSANTNTTSGSSSSNSGNGAAGNNVTVSGEAHTHNFGWANGEILPNPAYSHTVDGTFSSTGSGHNHSVTTTNAALNTNSSNQEQSHFKARALIKT